MISITRLLSAVLLSGIIRLTTYAFPIPTDSKKIRFKYGSITPSTTSNIPRAPRCHGCVSSSCLYQQRHNSNNNKNEEDDGNIIPILDRIFEALSGSSPTNTVLGVPPWVWVVLILQAVTGGMSVALLASVVYGLVRIFGQRVIDDDNHDAPIFDLLALGTALASSNLLVPIHNPSFGINGLPIVFGTIVLLILATWTTRASHSSISEEDDSSDGSKALAQRELLDLWDEEFRRLYPSENESDNHET